MDCLPEFCELFQQMIELEDSQIYGWLVRSIGDNLVGLRIGA